MTFFVQESNFLLCIISFLPMGFVSGTILIEKIKQENTSLIIAYQEAVCVLLRYDTT